MSSNQLALVDEIPQDNPEGKKKGEEDKCNVIGESLQELMAEKKLNVAELAAKTKIPFTTMDDWTNGRTIPFAGKNLLNLSKFLNVPLEFLCYGIGDKSFHKKYELLLEFFEYALRELSNESDEVFKGIKDKVKEIEEKFEQLV